MFGIGTGEILLILVVALLILGPSKLPDIARALGKGLAEFRRVSSDVKRTIDLESQLADLEPDIPAAKTGQTLSTENKTPATGPEQEAKETNSEKRENRKDNEDVTERAEN